MISQRCSWNLLGLLCLSLLVFACGPTGTRPDGGGDPGCTSGEVRCNGTCTNTDNDPLNCGMCSNQCAGGQACNGSGMCTTGCQAPLSNCKGSCVDLTLDNNNCGACNRMCLNTQVCSNSDCVEDTCTETSSDAQSVVLPADIIIAVDTSGSMNAEAAFVQNSMNDLVAALAASGIDANVIMISDSDICVPAPLGSGSCPADEALPNYRHVPTTVASSNALSLILSTYPQWQGSLRPQATKSIAVISDDNSALDAASFSSQMIALDATFQNFKFHAIVAGSDPSCLGCVAPACGCDPCCQPDPFGFLCLPLQASEGIVYKQLVSSTGGVLGELCTQDFLPAFQEMATAVINDSQISCVFDIPTPPNNETIDYSRVNVEYKLTPTSASVLVPQVPGGLADCTAAGGWYYDNPANPMQLILCPATCAIVQSSAEASVAVKFGCSTVVL